MLWSLLHTLSDDEREIVVLRYLLGWRVKQIAHRLAHKPNTISVRLKRALAKLRDRWPDQTDRSAS